MPEHTHRNRPADTGVEAVATILRGMLETARQDGYDAGYEDALSLSVDGSAQELAEQSDVAGVAQRVA